MSSLQKRLLKVLGILILALAIPLTLIAVQQRQEIRKKAVEANIAHFSLVPDSATLVVNETITAGVWLDSGDNGAVIVTSVINFDSDHLRVESINTTDVFVNDMSVTSVQEANADSIITIIQGLSAQQRDPVIGAHKIAQIEFKGTAPTGLLSADNVSFDTNESKVGNNQAGWMTITADGVKYEVCPRFDKGDANCDNRVDELDYVIWWQDYGTGLAADFNNDGVTDELDYVIWWQNFGNSW